MEHKAKESLLVRVGAALSTFVILGVSGLAYLLVADVYDMYPQLAYHPIFFSPRRAHPTPARILLRSCHSAPHAVTTPANGERSEMHVGLLRALPAHLVA